MDILLATKKHVPQIAALYNGLFTTMSELEPYFFKNTNQDSSFLETTIESDSSDLIIALINDDIVGFALIQLQETPPYKVLEHHQFAYITDLITKPEYRNQGIASALLTECGKWAKINEADYLELSVLNKNTNAYELYLKRGFAEKMTTLYKQID